MTTFHVSTFFGQATASDTIVLNWTVDNTPNGFQVERDGVIIATLDGSATSYTDTGLTPLTQYTYRLAIIQVEFGPPFFGEPLLITTLDTIPAAPSNLTGAGDNLYSITLAWTINSTNEQGFEIVRNGGTIAEVGPQTGGYDDTNIVSGVTYSYYVRSFNEAGHSAPSNVIMVSSVAPPPAPFNLIATVINTIEIDLSWQYTGPNNANIKVWRDNDLIADLLPGTTTYRDDRLQYSSFYTYTVSASNLAGESPMSNQASGMTQTPVVFDETMSGGVWLNGSGNDVHIYVPQGPPAGMLATDPATPFQFLFGPIIQPFGVLGAGAADNYDLNIVVDPFGVLGGGAADVS